MEEKKQILEKLTKRNQILKPIVFVAFKTEKELLEYRKKISKERDEYYDNQDEIDKLKYELLSPKEKEEYDEYRRLSKLKAEGKALI